MTDCRRFPLPVSRLAAAAKLADLLRNSLAQVVGEADVSKPYPIRVSPWNAYQLADVLGVCAHHRVSWSFDVSAETAGLVCWRIHDLLRPQFPGAVQYVYRGHGIVNDCSRQIRCVQRLSECQVSCGTGS